MSIPYQLSASDQALIDILNQAPYVEPDYEAQGHYANMPTFPDMPEYNFTLPRRYLNIEFTEIEKDSLEEMKLLVKKEVDDIDEKEICRQVVGEFYPPSPHTHKERINSPPPQQQQQQEHHWSDAFHGQELRCISIDSSTEDEQVPMEKQSQTKEDKAFLSAHEKCFVLGKELDTRKQPPFTEVAPSCILDERTTFDYSWQPTMIKVTPQPIQMLPHSFVDEAIHEMAREKYDEVELMPGEKEKIVRFNLCAEPGSNKVAYYSETIEKYKPYVNSLTTVESLLDTTRVDEVCLRLAELNKVAYAKLDAAFFKLPSSSEDDDKHCVESSVQCNGCECGCKGGLDCLCEHKEGSK